MKIKFNADLSHQVNAVEAVTALFDGQPRNEVAPLFQSVNQGGIAAVPNMLDLDDDTLLSNLQRVQFRHFTDAEGQTIRPKDDQLYRIHGTTLTTNGEQPISFPNFSVEMETGTGKTYIYIRTALELYQRYGYRKFIIVVPSVAIREGVLKTFEMTRDHFKRMFDNPPYRYRAYDSSSLNQVRQFALSDAVEFLVMTLAAFNKSTNVVYRSTDKLQGETPIFLLQAARPILILDEPQNMESDKSHEALLALNPLFALRYSATHRDLYNLVYRLTPREAYHQGLVKKIEVASVVNENNINVPFVEVKKIESKKQTVTAQLKIHQLQKSGQVKEKAVTVKQGDDLQDKSNRTLYAGWSVGEINVGEQWIEIHAPAITHKLALGDAIGTDRRDIFKAQIMATIQEHLQKQVRLQHLNIKVISLFFIDKVANFAGDGAFIPALFAEAFNALKPRLPMWRDLEPEAVSAGYFASKKAKGVVTFKDSTNGESKDDKAVYDLIMKNKEQLLSLDEPVSFIFSHSALREGWDNPNVFQICTLNQSVSDIRKRQEIGRGVRIAVNQKGERVFMDGVNTLTVVANESYQEFVTQYQQELNDAYSQQIIQRFGKKLKDLSGEEREQIERELNIQLPPKPEDAQKRTEAVLTAQLSAAYPELDAQPAQAIAEDGPIYQSSDGTTQFNVAPLDGQRHKLADGNSYDLPLEFVQLWDKIRHRTRYKVTVDTPKLIDDVVKELARPEHRIDPGNIVMRKAQVKLDTAGAFQALQTSAARKLIDLDGRFPLPNIVDVMMNLMQQTSPPMRLTRKTLLEIIRQAPNQQILVQNPQGFAVTAVNIIKQKLADQLVDGIVYTKTGQVWEMDKFQPAVETYQYKTTATTKTLYDKVIFDSDVERRFVQGLENLEQVSFYLKLPDWFKIETPIGGYNPDWAIVWNETGPDGEEEQHVYMVRETKGTTDLAKLQYANEPRKIRSGHAHFYELNVDFATVKDAGEVRPNKLV